MAYTLPVGKSAVFLDETGTAIPEGATSGSVVDPSIANFEGGHADGLHLRGLAIGQTDVTLTRDGSPATHTVSVVQSPFDWTLGDPV